MITVHGFSPSGNCHKLRLLLEQLGEPYRWVEVDSSQGQTRSAQFLALNPNGKVPVIELDDGRTLSESNAILYYLADGSRFLPSDRWQRAQALSWMNFEQYSHEPYIAVARFIAGWTPLDSPRRAELPALRERGHRALAVMERHLQSHDWFSGADYGIADIALFAYTDVAGHGGIGLDGYPALRAWLARVRATEGFVALPEPDEQAAQRIAQTA
ncbi:glutathione S-transferase family protein [Lysobacter sp. BMK333-48F3]|uniref:glutathione S-transferase family protein n=1 Tax=Lysobacter sp. BMK333-48F3 TaxID=2867962 RepID=UPI001C8BF139|nr:glutathione S-transferase family protein [Lysobacter sp. BMK333-48F3]MBX9403568.1 glutathione S-transferase family protein [Lysobacter sp. BMK333-48F3]